MKITEILGTIGALLIPTLVFASVTTVPWNYDTVANTYYTYPNVTGKVGVATTTPNNALDVNGTIYGTSWNFFGTSPTGVSGTGNIVLSANPTLSGTAVTANLRTGTAGNADLEVLGATFINRNTVQLAVPTATTTDTRINVRGSTAATGTWGANYATLDIGQEAYTENAQSTSVAPLLSQIMVRPLVLTNGNGATTDAATVYIEGGAMGTVTPTDGNYALWIASSTSKTRIDGALGIATSSPYARLSIHANPTDTTVYNTLFAIGSSTTLATTTLLSVDNTGQVLHADGSASAPSLSFLNNSNMGLYRNGSNIFDVSVAGTSQWEFNNGSVYSQVSSNGLRLFNASADSTTVPVFVPDRADVSTGIGAGTTGNINFMVGGAEKARFTSTGLGIGTTTPIAPLTVANGSLQFSNGGNPNQQAILQVAGSGLTGVGIGNYSGGYGAIQGLASNVSSGTYLYLNPLGGAVGVGNANGLGSCANTLCAAAGTTIGSGYWANAAPSNGLLVQGNVGISTTTPYSKLSVWGADTTAGHRAFEVTNSASTTNFAVNNDGETIGRDAANNWAGRITPTHHLLIPFATSTATWTASSTSGVDIAPSVVATFAGTIQQVYCNVNTFLGVNIKINGTSIAPSYFVASSTSGKITVTGTNTFTVGNTISATVGTTTSATASSGVVNGSCTLDVTETP